MALLDQVRDHGVPNACMPVFLDANCNLIDCYGNLCQIAQQSIPVSGVTSLNQNNGGWIDGDITLLNGPGVAISYEEPPSAFRFTNTGVRSIRTVDSAGDDTSYIAGYYGSTSYPPKTVALRESATVKFSEEMGPYEGAGNIGSNDMLVQFHGAYSAGVGMQLQEVGIAPSDSWLVNNTGVVAVKAMQDEGTPAARNGVVKFKGAGGISVTSTVDTDASASVPYAASTYNLLINAQMTAGNIPEEWGPVQYNSVIPLRYQNLRGKRDDGILVEPLFPHLGYVTTAVFYRVGRIVHAMFNVNLEFELFEEPSYTDLANALLRQSPTYVFLDPFPYVHPLFHWDTDNIPDTAHMVPKAQTNFLMYEGAALANENSANQVIGTAYIWRDRIHLARVNHGNSKFDFGVRWTLKGNWNGNTNTNSPNGIISLTYLVPPPPKI
jgi:hypothetical protein